MNTDNLEDLKVQLVKLKSQEADSKEKLQTMERDHQRLMSQVAMLVYEIRILEESQRPVLSQNFPRAIYNPQNKPKENLPIIYGFNDGGSPGWYRALLLAEDGTPLSEHLCSDESYMLHDLGIVEGARPDHHKRFQKHYPGGYRMEFVSYDDVNSHAKLMESIEKAKQLSEAMV